ncbi:MAG: right-handed parallel beta-helix repeat-containing protein, partial [Acidimicrobiia bacterium]|nr:right-handed parallel beta-helix repeat-containing protein [Acidimicrobiia bacterium]
QPVTGAAAPEAGAGGSSNGSTAVPAAVDPLAPRICTLPGERTGETDELYNGTDPNRKLLPYSPFRIINFPCANFPTSLRATLVYLDAVVLLQGGSIYKSVPFDGAGTVTLGDVVAAVDDPDWMAEVAEGVFMLDTALVQLGGTSLDISSPEVSEVRFSTRPDVFLGGRGATALIQDVRITSWDPNRGGIDTNTDDGRAFILYERGSRLDILDSEIIGLGSDRSGAYGTSWRTGGTTGSTINTLYDQNWFGVYTFEARDILFEGNTFSNNVYYGLDPHDYSIGLIVENNVAFGNGSHGLIFSRGVSDSVMRNNHSYNNGGNGIVVDMASDRVIIENNIVENNKKDGIVYLASGEGEILNNTVRGNRTGIRLSQVGTTDIHVEGNYLEANASGIHAYGGASDVTIVNNVITNTTRPGIIADAAPVSISNVEISSAPVGIEARTAVEIVGARISDVDVGVVASNAGIVEIKDSDIVASDTGLQLKRGSFGSIDEASAISADRRVYTPVDRPFWRKWMPYVGVAVVLIAILLEILRGARTAGEGLRLAPPGVVNVR